MEAEHGSSDMLSHYDSGVEESRLAGRGGLELARTKEIVARVLPDSICRVYDVGGGPGEYAFWLASKGHHVELLDIVPLHVEQATRRSRTGPVSLASIELGDARELPREDACFDLVLLLGPLYHLQERMDRMACLAEAMRVLRPGGSIVVAAISRFASALDGISRGLLGDEEFAAIVDEDLRSGRHLNTKRRPGYFTTAYFHEPSELLQEVADAGFADLRLHAVEGPAWLTQFSLDDCSERSRARFFELLRMIESEQSLIGASAHFVCIAKKE